MIALNWRNRSGKIKPIPSAPYGSEQEFEREVFSTQELLGDIHFLKRQVRGGSKPGVPDIIGIDDEGKVCIVEMKNVPVDASVIPQILKYAIWAESNPDSIKSLWYEAIDKDEDREIDWENLEVRILVIAPSIDRSALEYVNKIDYQVDLIEISRWRLGREAWLMVNKLEPSPQMKHRPVSGLVEYDEKAYSKYHKPAALKAFLKACSEMQAIVKRNKWPVEKSFRKHYCCFKVGNSVVFGVKWIGSKSFGYYAHVPESVSRRFKARGFEARYRRNRALYIPEKPSSTAKKLARLFKSALNLRLGEPD